MSLQQIYTTFLASPRSNALDPSASIHYITTGASVNTADAILKQLTRENNRQLKKRVEKVIASIETQNSLVLEIETEIEFLTSGANYLPGLDDNFLADHVVAFLVVHIVNFENGLIKEARLYWDQSTLLKQLSVIGRTGRNWPIKDGRDQIKAVLDSVSHQASSSSVAANPSSAETNGHPADPHRSRTSSNSSSHVTRDPHSSLHLSRSADEEPETVKVRAPRSNSTFSPPSRDLKDIIGEPHRDEAPHQRPLPPKAGSSFSRGQTFEFGGEYEEEESETPVQKERKVHLDPKKYSHFEFGDGEDVAASQPSKPKTVANRNVSSWDFADFVTPEKKPVKKRPDDVRHFSWGDEDDHASPIKGSKKVVSRRDAEPELRMNKSEGASSNVLGKVSNANSHKLRNNDHFDIGDNSPAGTRAKNVPLSKQAVLKTVSQQAGLKTVDARDPADDTTEDFFASFGKETTQNGIFIAGNGQGQRKNLGKSWSWDQQSPSNGARKENLPGKTAGPHPNVGTQGGDGKGLWDH